jgi:hypothetical protein
VTALEKFQNAEDITAEKAAEKKSTQLLPVVQELALGISA